MYLSQTWFTLMLESVGKSRASGSSTGSPYCDMKLGSAFGTLLPPWQVKQVTRGVPLKYCLLIAFISVIICRARCIRGVCSAKAALLSAEFAAWQNVQSLPMELAKVPITSKKVSTGMPRNSWTVLKGSPTIGTRSPAFCAAGAVWAPWGDAARKPPAATRHTTVTDVAHANIRLAPTLIGPPYEVSGIRYQVSGGFRDTCSTRGAYRNHWRTQPPIAGV